MIMMVVLFSFIVMIMRAVLFLIYCDNNEGGSVPHLL